MKLYELSKMDGAIGIPPDLSTIYRANAQLNPDPAIASRETGLRHLAAHRTAQKCGVLTLAISERRKTVTLYLGEQAPRRLDPVGVVLDKAGAALTTLEKFAGRLRNEARLLTIHEFEGSVNLKEVVEALKTFEYTVHITEEIEDYITELGEEGRLIRLQLEQSTHWIPEQHEGLLRDYVPEGVSPKEVRERLQSLSTDQLSGGQPGGRGPRLRSIRTLRRGCTQDSGLPPALSGSPPARAGSGAARRGVRLLTRAYEGLKDATHPRRGRRLDSSTGYKAWPRALKRTATARRAWVRPQAVSLI